MTINWTVSDGYVNPGPQHVEVDDQELIDACSIEDAMEIVEDAVHDDFLDKVSACYDSSAIRLQIEALRAQ
jgi:hypothetical protein